MKNEAVEIGGEPEVTRVGECAACGCDVMFVYEGGAVGFRQCFGCSLQGVQAVVMTDVDGARARAYARGVPYAPGQEIDPDAAIEVTPDELAAEAGTPARRPEVDSEPVTAEPEEVTAVREIDALAKDLEARTTAKTPVQSFAAVTDEDELEETKP